MQPSDPVPRLLRLHAMARRTAPADGHEIKGSNAAGLSEAYSSLRESTRQLAIDLGLTTQEFDAALPVLASPAPVGVPTPEAFMEQASHAATAAARLRLLSGYLEGLVEMTLLTEDLTTEQVARIRGALDR